MMLIYFSLSIFSLKYRTMNGKELISLLVQVKQKYLLAMKNNNYKLQKHPQKRTHYCLLM
jgi:hypothetical protein